MAHIYSPNIAAVANDAFAHQWQGIRAMLKAGWMLRHSADATNKASANSADPMQCKWGVPAIVQDLSSTGVAHIGAQVGKDFLFTDLSGLSVPSATNRGGSEGNILVVTNATNPGNNVSWLITHVVDGTSCYARPLVPSSVTSGGTSPPTMTIFGHLARTRTFNLRVQSDTIGALGTCKVKISLDGGSTYAAAVVIPTTQTVEVIDSNGVATGIYLYFSAPVNNANDNFWTATSAVANDDGTGGSSGLGNGRVRWVERSWLTTAYNAMANGAWIAIEGPCTLKIPFTSAPNGTFIRGENITQATSLAEGEVVGVTYEPTTGVGYLVVQPRLQGGGTGAEGWGTGVITGAKSGTTVTPSAVPVRLVREMVFWRGNTLGNGTVYYQPILDTTENAQRFGWLSMMAGTTATVCPGGGGTNNAFPATAYAVTGTGGSASHNPNAWIGSNYALTNTIGRLQHFAANAIDKQTAWALSALPNTSGDGSFFGIIGQPSVSAASAGMLPTLMRCDNGEDGDLEPYVMFVTMASSSTTRSRLGNTSAASFTEVVPGLWGANYNVNVSSGWWAGWRRRGLPTGDAYAEYAAFLYYAPWSTNQYLQAYANNLVDQDRVGSTAATTAPLALEPIFLACPTTTTRSRKGTTRWFWIGTGATAYDTYGAKTVLQCFTTDVNQLARLGGFMPYDGSTTPAQ